MMRVVRNPFFYIPALLFVLNQILEKAAGIFLPLVHSYLDDLLAMPVILGVTLQIYQFIHPSKDCFHFRKRHVLVAFIYVSLVFEVILPRFSDVYTADLFDVLCYAVGSGVFYRFINRSLPRENRPVYLASRSNPEENGN